MSTTAQALLAEAQELFDQRIDPLAHADFALRAFALSLPTGVAQAPQLASKPVGVSRHWWLAPVAAAAALLLMLNAVPENLPPSAQEPELIVQAPGQPPLPAKVVATPAVLHFSQSTESTTLSPPPTGDVLFLSITSRRIIRP